jgi:hypothetical protein
LNKYILFLSIFIYSYQSSPLAKNYLSFINQIILSENIRLVEILNKEQYLVNTNEKGIQEIHQRQCDFTICDIITNDKSYFFICPDKVSRPEIEKYCTVLHSFSDFYLVSVESDEKLTMLALKPVKLHRVSIDIPSEINTTQYMPITSKYQNNLLCQ